MVLNLDLCLTLHEDRRKADSNPPGGIILGGSLASKVNNASLTSVALTAKTASFFRGLIGQAKPPDSMFSNYFWSCNFYYKLPPTGCFASRPGDLVKFGGAGKFYYFFSVGQVIYCGLKQCIFAAWKITRYWSLTLLLQRF